MQVAQALATRPVALARPVATRRGRVAVVAKAQTQDVAKASAGWVVGALRRSIESHLLAAPRNMPATVPRVANFDC